MADVALRGPFELPGQSKQYEDQNGSSKKVRGTTNNQDNHTNIMKDDTLLPFGVHLETNLSLNH